MGTLSLFYRLPSDFCSHLPNRNVSKWELRACANKVLSELSNEGQDLRSEGKTRTNLGLTSVSDVVSLSPSALGVFLFLFLRFTPYNSPCAKVPFITSLSHWGSVVGLDSVFSNSMFFMIFAVEWTNWQLLSQTENVSNKPLN